MHGPISPLAHVTDELVTTIFHKKDGPTRMYRADANAAVQLHPGEWRRTPWPGQDGAAEVPEG